ncbi:MAG TPA: aldehyde dehydrogenase family protein [Candidatus Binatia bacterium]|nr:aldehyde dehydrogenase family protein [Candidatus Binatia bacterium]
MATAAGVAAATEAADVRRYDAFINGKFVPAESGKTFESRNPATGELVAVVAEGDKPDVDKAAVAARACYENVWSAMPVAERGRLLLRVAQKIQERMQELAHLETLDMGGPMLWTTGTAMQAVEVFEYWAGMATKIQGEVNPSMLPGESLNYVLREPLGVVGGITPWNGPLIMAAWKTAPAIACGNAVVLKPAELTPMTALELARIFTEAGAPDGLFNVVPGFGPTAGAALAAHPDVDKIAFTGETATGQEVARNAIVNLKVVTLELGGKSPHIVFDDVDVDRAVANAIFGIYTNCGQVCTSGSRIFVHERIYDSFVEKMVARAKAIRVGDPLDPSTQLGPLVSEEQLDRVKRYVEIGKQEGARVLCGGGPPDDPKLARGHYFLPTVFVDVHNKMRVAQEEIFGPVACVMKFSDEEDVLRQANDIVYGLAAGIQTNDIKRAHKLARRLKAGSVWINCYHRIETSCPFGGYKLSGYGRENGVGMVNYLTRMKSVSVDLNDFTMDLFA